jgi:hypothetical protein
MDPERVYGVDFSGAQNAERNVWIAGGPLTDDGVDIETLGSARELLGDASGREATHDALVDWLRERESAAVGLDFSFGLPSTLLDAMEDSPGHWTAFLDAFPPDGCSDPDSFEDWGKERTREATDGERAFLKRETDEQVGASSPYGFIGSTITFYGIRDVLAPLILGDDDGRGVAEVAPMQTTTFEPPVTLLETYPAGVLDDLGLQRRNYKGASDAERAARRENLEGLTSSVDVSVYDDDRTTIVDDTGGDALDAVVAAAATYRAVDGDFAHDENHYDEREGDIYV